MSHQFSSKRALIAVSLATLTFISAVQAGIKEDTASKKPTRMFADASHSQPFLKPQDSSQRASNGSSQGSSHQINVAVGREEEPVPFIPDPPLYSWPPRQPSQQINEPAREKEKPFPLTPLPNNSTYLDLSRQHLGWILKQKEKSAVVRVAKNLRENWKAYQSVSSVALSGCSLTEDSLSALMGPLMGLPKLDTLALSHNNLRDNGAIYLAKVLPGFRSLHWLDLTQNNIGDVGVEALLKSLPETSLREISLSSNSLTEGLKKKIKDTTYTNKEGKTVEVSLSEV